MQFKQRLVEVKAGYAEVDHREFSAMLGTKTVEDIRSIISEASKAIRSFPGTRRARYYEDEMRLCVHELSRRATQLFDALRLLQAS